MPRKAVSTVDEASLSKGQLRKLNALRKSLGEEIADKAFSEWLASTSSEQASSGDPAADALVELLEPKVISGEIRIPRGGYIIRRGHGRVIVERAA